MNTSQPFEPEPKFDFLTLRRLVGFVAFALPWVVWAVASFAPLQSISASYYYDSRNVFVGALFVIAVLLYAYRGHTVKEDRMANLGAIGAIVAALWPVGMDENDVGLHTALHLLGGTTMFLVIAYFCLWPFRQSALSKPGDNAQRRATLYTYCGYIIFLCVVLAGIAMLPPFKKLGEEWRLTFVFETIALLTFGFAWIVASRLKFLFLSWFAD